MTHKFNEKNMKKLDNPIRRKKLPPKQTLLNLGLSDGDIIADIGCAIGYFSLPASDIVGDSGKVYAIDISKAMLDVLKNKINENNITNITLIQSKEYDFGLDENSVNFAFMCNVLHEIENKERFLNEIKNILNNNGKISIIEWAKKETEFGPPIDHRLSRQECNELLINNGFNEISVTDIGNDFYSITGVKA